MCTAPRRANRSGLRWFRTQRPDRRRRSRLRSAPPPSASPGAARAFLPQRHVVHGIRVYNRRSCVARVGLEQLSCNRPRQIGTEERQQRDRVAQLLAHRRPEPPRLLGGCQQQQQHGDVVRQNAYTALKIDSDCLCKMCKSIACVSLPTKRSKSRGRAQRQRSKRRTPFLMAANQDEDARRTL